MSGTLAFAIVGGLAGGMLARALRLPGGALLGAVLGAAGVQLAVGGDDSLPSWVRIGTQIAIGGVIGSNLELDAFRGMGRILLRTLPLLAALFACAAALGVAFAALVPTSMTTGLLSTVPGGASDMIAIALETGDGASIVAAVHLLRLLIIYGVLGALFRLLLPPMPATPDAEEVEDR